MHSTKKSNKLILAQILQHFYGCVHKYQQWPIEQRTRVCACVDACVSVCLLYFSFALCTVNSARHPSETSYCCWHNNKLTFYWLKNNIFIVIITMWIRSHEVMILYIQAHIHTHTHTHKNVCVKISYTMFNLWWVCVCVWTRVSFCGVTFLWARKTYPFILSMRGTNNASMPTTIFVHLMDRFNNGRELEQTETKLR